MPLYSVSVSGWDCWILCLKASVWDAVIITCVYYFIDTPNKRHRYMVSACILLLVAVIIEQRALIEGRWAYSHLMPTVLGIGLSPLFQLPLLAIATFRIHDKIATL